MDGTSPTVPRRRLGNALRALRLARGLTGEQAGVRVERSGSWISRIEGGRMGIRARDLRDLLDLYQVTEPDEREELLALAQKGRERSWWSEYSGSISETYSTFIGLEDEATRFESYESMAVPGLLQTEEYARSVIAGGVPRPSEQVLEDRIRLRIRRQQVLAKTNPLHLSLIIREGALSQQVGGPTTMLRQLEHVAEVARQPNVELRVLLDKDADPLGGLAQFVLIYLESDRPDSVYLEDFTGGRFEEGRSIEPYQEIFARFRTRALGREESIDRIRQAILELTGI